MKKHLKTLFWLVSASMLWALPAFADTTEADVEAAITAQGKDAVSGNLFLWFLCAIAFLKVSTKLDSFLSSLGVGCGRPAGSLLTEALMAIRGMEIGKAFSGHGGGLPFGKKAASAPQQPGGLSGGLVGVVGRKVQSDTTNALAGTNAGGGLTAGIGSAMYKSSLGEEGGFASKVIGSIATGQTAGFISGEDASTALEGYFGTSAAMDADTGMESATNQPIPATPLAMDGGGDAIPVSPGYEAELAAETIGPAPDEPQASIPTSPGIQQAALQRLATGEMGNPTADVEIGGGKITGREIVPGKGSIQFAMYNARQFERPSGHYSVQQSLDGEKWYKVYAHSAVERTPTTKDNSGRYQYEERIVATLPKAPNRRR